MIFAKDVPVLTGIEIDRFLSKIKRTNSCWLWEGRPNRGYGWFCVRREGERPANQLHRAHRVAFVLYKGAPPKSPYILDHICSNRICVNPEHLRVVSPQENLLSSLNTHAGKNARKGFCSRGHPFSGRNLRVKHLSNGYTERVCRTCMKLWQ